MPSKRGSGKKIFLLICLAVLCIGGTELLVCRFAAPELYARITRPIAVAAQRISDAGQALLARAVSSKPPQEEEDMPVDQLASTPLLENTLPQEDPKITEFVQHGDTETLTGGTVELVYFNQAEEPWASAPYGPDSIDGYGCGPTAMAMVVSSLTEQTVDPKAMAQWSYEHGYCAPGSGSHYGLIQAAADAYGLDAQAWTDLSADGISQALASGHIFVALMTQGHFTSGGHFIVLRGVTLNGKILVADPNSRERSLTAWDPQLIVDELSPTRAAGAPLWCLSTIPGT